MTRGRKRHPERLEQDLVISLVLSNGDRRPPPEIEGAPALRDLPGGVIIHDDFLGDLEVPRFKSVPRAAAWLSLLWLTHGFHMSPEVIKTRYYLLKKVDGENTPDYVKKRL